MVPTSLPELPKPSRTLGKKQKPQFLNPAIYRKIRNKSLFALINPFLGDTPPGRWTGHLGRCTHGPRQTQARRRPGELSDGPWIATWQVLHKGSHLANLFIHRSICPGGPKKYGP